ncbi:glutamate 5-kinase [Campylobacter sp. RM16192]|uniref:glutamate 5-kinase n=1 Tax=Campylobacter sp. RM16192 TaxID=1660080 RepID=UPI00145287E7|nr:glutamate 5-kinase [Campylobacter sp. RM16192]QCD53414.1 gamma-glutamyl kinase [Campylobacter sp. RM16192]
MSREALKDIKRVVIKVGTSTLTKSSGKLNEEKIKRIVASIASLADEGFEVALVTSGAVGAGMGELNINERPKTLNEKQALASVGQVALIHLYQILFWAHGKTIAQLLLTRGDFSDRNRYLNARNVCGTLLSKNIIPIINENDPVVSDELKVGDNDTLSALVSGLIDADLLIILSDIDGLYDKNPNVHKDAKFIKLVEDINEDIKSMAQGEGSKFGTGGMKTKIIAAQMATKIGTNLIIVNGENPENIIRAVKGEEIGTLFLRQDKKISSRKYWLGYGTSKKGTIIIDEGAAKALKNGKSLLSVGIKGISGEFERGQIVEILNSKDELIAKGISNYSSSEIMLIKGRKSEEIEEILGHKYDDDIVHIDNLLLV